MASVNGHARKYLIALLKIFKDITLLQPTRDNHFQSFIELVRIDKQQQAQETLDIT
jgi:hypothetical protein